MKNLRKINKGFILTLIVLIGLIVYLVGVEKQREAEKVNIIDTMERFIEVTDKYSVYPENINNLSKRVTAEESDKYIEEMKEELKKVMIPNEEVVKLQAQSIENVLKMVNQEREIKTETKRKIMKISDYEFDGDQVTVEFESVVEITRKYLDEEGKEQTRQDKLISNYDEIILQKIEDEWKVVYSNLEYDQYKYYSEDVMIMY